MSTFIGRDDVVANFSNKKLTIKQGPKEKTVVMGINQTIKIEQTAKLKVIGIRDCNEKAIHCPYHNIID